jgi:Zn-dependent metalloprotease
MRAGLITRPKQHSPRRKPEMKSRRTIVALLFFTLVLAGHNGARGTGTAVHEFQASQGTEWTYHYSAENKVRAIYGSGKGRSISNRDQAKQFFRDHADLFGIEDISHLHLERISTDRATGSSYHFGQYHFGIPVVGAEISLHTDRFGKVIAASSGYRSLRGLAGGSFADHKQARETAGRLSVATGEISNGALMILPGFAPRFAWKFHTSSKESIGQWGVYVDALAPWKILRVQPEFFEATATGSVFRENPIVTPNQTSESLPYLKNAGTLIGKFAKIYNANFSLPFRSDLVDQYTRASESDHDYTFPIADARFAEAMAYYHINLVHDRWRSLGFKKLNRQLPVFVNVSSFSGAGFDNAFYTRGGPFRNGAIIMGSGNRLENFGHDGDVYYHEYGHAVLDHAKPRLFEEFEHNYPGAFHEAFGDISSAGITGNARLAEFALRIKETGRFIGRDLDNKNRYPQDVLLKGFGRSESHHTGLIIGGAWWDLQKQIGIEKAQRILFQSLAILPNDLTFFDIRDSMLAADRRKNAGSNAAAIQNAFANRGITGEDPGQKGTIDFRSLKTARFNFANNGLKLTSKFKPGDFIVVLSNYEGRNLTPAYNLIPDFQISGPPGGNVNAFPTIDEAVNGSHTGKQGAWAVQIQTFESSAPGEYLVTVRYRLGGTTQLTQTKTVKFKIVL